MNPRCELSSTSFRTSSWRWCYLIALSAVVLGGCQPDQGARTKRRSAPVTTSAIATHDQLLKAMEYLNRIDEFDREQAFGQAAYHLNRWLDEQKPDPDWKVDPLTTRLPRDIRESDLLKDVADWTFSISDVQAIQEAAWLRDLADWVSRRPPNARLKTWLEQQGDTLDSLQRENLAIAELLFDWTIRNIQLEPTSAYPAEEAAPSEGGEPSRQTRLPAPQRAIPGPGYRFPPAEILQYGYGDAHQRSRVFIELARQQGIEAVYLATPGKSIPPRPRPWLTAVVVGTELYLFDIELGLPIPGVDGQGIATLTQVLDNPKILENLQVGDQPYRISHKELTELLALIDAAPATLSQRMHLVQSQLAGDERTILAVFPSQIAQRVGGMRGISQVSLWSVPFETIWFQNAMRKLLQTDQQVAMGYFRAVGIFQNRGTLTQARHLHLQGTFDQHGEKLGAKGLYMQARVPTAAIERIGTSPEVQAAMGLVRGRQEGDFVWQARLANAHMFTLQAKEHATYWLGLSHYETGNYDASITWLKDRTLGTTPDGLWTPGARYNLARAYEALGQIEQARELYLEDDSPQAAGNRLRAKLIKQWQSP